MKVMTILEGWVTQSNWSTLKQGYRLAAQAHDAGLVQSFLVQGARELELWRILTVWESREALDAMRGSVETPRGVLIFRAAGAEPSLSIFEVTETINPG